MSLIPSALEKHLSNLSLKPSPSTKNTVTNCAVGLSQYWVTLKVKPKPSFVGKPTTRPIDAKKPPTGKHTNEYRSSALVVVGMWQRTAALQLAFVSSPNAWTICHLLLRDYDVHKVRKFQPHRPHIVEDLITIANLNSLPFPYRSAPTAVYMIQVLAPCLDFKLP